MSKKRYLPRNPFLAHGFRAQDLRNLPREAWWAKHWLQAIDAMRLGARAGRGKVYAERGQVTGIELDGTRLTAVVMGARKDPYEVKIDFRRAAFAGEGMSRAFGVMTAGRVHAGEMPVAVEETFVRRGEVLYPALGGDTFWCSCPDWSKPCKHIAAVLYLLGDALVREPSLLLRLRGFEDVAGGLPLWKGEKRLAETVAGIVRRVEGAR